MTRERLFLRLKRTEKNILNDHDRVNIKKKRIFEVRNKVAIKNEDGKANKSESVKENDKDQAKKTDKHLEKNNNNVTLTFLLQATDFYKKLTNIKIEPCKRSHYHQDQTQPLLEEEEFPQTEKNLADNLASFSAPLQYNPDEIFSCLVNYCQSPFPR